MSYRLEIVGQNYAKANGIIVGVLIICENSLDKDRKVETRTHLNKRGETEKPTSRKIKKE